MLKHRSHFDHYVAFRANKWRPEVGCGSESVTRSQIGVHIIRLQNRYSAEPSGPELKPKVSTVSKLLFVIIEY